MWAFSDLYKVDVEGDTEQDVSGHSEAGLEVSKMLRNTHRIVPCPFEPVR